MNITSGKTVLSAKWATSSCKNIAGASDCKTAALESAWGSNSWDAVLPLARFHEDKDAKEGIEENVLPGKETVLNYIDTAGDTVSCGFCRTWWGCRGLMCSAATGNGDVAMLLCLLYATLAQRLSIFFFMRLTVCLFCSGVFWELDLP